MRSRALQLHPGLQTPSYSSDMNWIHQTPWRSKQVWWSAEGLMLTIRDKYIDLRGRLFCITGIPRTRCRTAFKHPCCSQNSAQDSHFLLKSLCLGFHILEDGVAVSHWGLDTHTLTRQPRGPESKHLETHNPHSPPRRHTQRTHGRWTAGPFRSAAAGSGVTSTGCSDCLVCCHRIHCEDVQRYVQRTSASCRTHVKLYNATCRAQ